MLSMVMLAQENRACVSDHFYLRLRHAASVALNLGAHAHRGHFFPRRPVVALRLGEVMSKDSHGQSLQRLMSDPFLTTPSHSGSRHSSVIPTEFRSMQY